MQEINAEQYFDISKWIKIDKRGIRRRANQSGGDIVKSKTIQETLARVLSIEEASVQMEESIEALKGTKEKELKKQERELELVYMKEARKKGKEAYDRVMEEAKKTEEEIMEEGDIQDKRMKRLFEKNEDELVKKALQAVLGSTYALSKE